MVEIDFFWETVNGLLQSVAEGGQCPKKVIDAVKWDIIVNQNVVRGLNTQGLASHICDLIAMYERK
jgi:hypothetical protein